MTSAEGTKKFHYKPAPLHFTCWMTTFGGSKHSEGGLCIFISCWIDTFNGSKHREVRLYIFFSCWIETFNCSKHSEVGPYLFSKHRPSEPMLSITRNVCLSVCLSICLFTYEVPFKRLFAPTARSRMSSHIEHI